MIVGSEPEDLLHQLPRKLESQVIIQRRVLFYLHIYHYNLLLKKATMELIYKHRRLEFSCLLPVQLRILSSISRVSFIQQVLNQITFTLLTSCCAPHTYIYIYYLCMDAPYGRKLVCQHNFGHPADIWTVHYYSCLDKRRTLLIVHRKKSAREYII